MRGGEGAREDPARPFPKIFPGKGLDAAGLVGPAVEGRVPQGLEGLGVGLPPVPHVLMNLVVLKLGVCMH